MSSTPRPIQSVSNAELYNRWAKVYDTDGNILQSIDDRLLPSLLTQAFTLLSTNRTPITITELGCGTGRNTIKLLNPSLPITTINALDLSSSMLGVAKDRCSILTTPSPPQISFFEFDALNPASFPLVKDIEGKADLVLSTLVLEHLPIITFFATLKSLIKPEGGYVIITNMHAEMGRKGQAGFVDEATGIKVRGTSYNYEVGEVVEEGRNWGFSVIGELVERGVEESDVGRVVGERGRKWVGCRCWFGVVMRFEESVGFENY